MSDNMIIDNEYGGKNDEENSNSYLYYNPPTQFSRISQAEARLKNDFVEFENKRMTTNQFQVNLSNAIMGEDQKSFLMSCEFVGLFNIVIIIKEDYPFSHPDIIYHSGPYIDVFYNNGLIKLSFLTKEKWSPVLSLNSILFSIELLLLEDINSRASKLNERQNEICNVLIYSKLSKDDLRDKYKNNKRKKKYCEFIEKNKEFIMPSDIGEQMLAFNNIIKKIKKINL